MEENKKTIAKLLVLAITKRGITQKITRNLSQKIAIILAILTSVTASLGNLQKMLCIQYPVKFKEDGPKIKTLIDFASEINTITSSYVAR